jgi:hypothetical protein
MAWGPDHLAIFIPALGMVTVFALNYLASYHRTSRLTDRDTRGLRMALLSELVLLHGLIGDNLVLVGNAEEYLLSVRVLTQVYRSNVGRLHLLSEAEIEAVVSGYGTTEAAEVFVGAVSKAHGAHAYRAWLGDSAWEDIGRRLRLAHAAVELAIRQLSPAWNAPNVRHRDADEIRTKVERGELVAP